MSSLVSVIVPVYNRFKEADRAIKSVLDQTYKNWELIVIDDASFDNYKLPYDCNKNTQKILLIRNNKNLGPGLSRQIGLDTAQGKYICFLDSDDYYDSEFLFLSLKTHYNFPEISATYATSKYIQSNQIREGSEISFNKIMPTLFKNNRPWPTCSLLWKRDLVASWSSLRTNQDSMFELHCSFINNNIRHVSEVLCYIDKGTGYNTSDLVKQSKSDIDRNTVVIYALKNMHKYINLQNEYYEIKKSIIKRIFFVSSKLAGHGLWLRVFINGIKLFKYNFLKGLVLIIVSISIALPFASFRNLTKKILARFA